MEVTVRVMVGLLFCSLIDASEVESKFWAVLIAGSSGWQNYRHQADVCHAYHILVNKGVPRERIITLMYDDIANNKKNPQKGKIINKPNGEDVYEGVVIDYSGLDVTVETLRNVLLGNEEARTKNGSGKVLLSGERDQVFINFVDHGGPGVLGFPNELLHSSDLLNIIKEMKKLNKFKTLTFYIEACNAGSMFDNILGEGNQVFVSAASAPDESSYACYCESELETCLGDLYSVTWMNRWESLNSSQSLFEDFDAVRTQVLKKSHVNIYGDYSVGFNHLPLNFSSKKSEVSYEDPYYLNENSVDNRDVPLYLAYRQMHRAANGKDNSRKRDIFENMVQSRRFGDELISKIMDKLTDGNIDLKKDLEMNNYPLNENMLDCYKAITTAFENNCFKIYQNTYFFQHMYKFVNMCVKKLDRNKVIHSIQSVCQGMFESDLLII